MSLALVFATIDRPHVAQRLIKSVRSYFPEMPICVADQSAPSLYMKEFYDRYGIQVVWMEHDSGVCESRNAAVSMVEEDYFVLCDDDFIFTAETAFDDAIKILEDEHGIAVVGGRLQDVHETTDVIEGKMRYWEMYFLYDPGNKLLVTMPIDRLAPDAKVASGVKYFLCDAVMNFAVFRRSIFSETIRWDPLFKSNGEHEDFYLNLKVNSDYKVAYLPSMLAEHHHPPCQAYARLRSRTHGWLLFMKKWGLEQYLEVGLGLRTLADLESARDLDSSHDTLRTSQWLDLQSNHKPYAGTFEVDLEGGIVPVKSRNKHDYKVFDDGFSTVFSVRLNRYFRVKEGLCRIRKAKKMSGASDARMLPTGSLGDISLFVKYPAVINRDSDFFVYAQPSGFDYLQGTLSGGEITYSWRYKNDYLIFQEPIMDYLGDLQHDEWNALNLKVPHMPGVLTFEIHYLDRQKDSQVLLATGDVLSSSDFGCDVEDLWVTAWSPARLWREGLTKSAMSFHGGEQADVGEATIKALTNDVFDGVHPHLLTLDDSSVRKGRTPQILALDIFPYTYGAGRNICECVGVQGEDVHFLLPVSTGQEGKLRLSLNDKDLFLNIL